MLGIPRRRHQPTVRRDVGPGTLASNWHWQVGGHSKAAPVSLTGGCREERSALSDRHGYIVSRGRPLSHEAGSDRADSTPPPRPPSHSRCSGAGPTSCPGAGKPPEPSFEIAIDPGLVLRYTSQSALGPPGPAPDRRRGGPARTLTIEEWRRFYVHMPLGKGPK